MRASTIIGVLVLTVVCMVRGEERGGVAWVEGSTEPLLQLTGEVCQYQAYGRSYTGPTLNKTLSNYNLNGADLGVPVTFQDKIVLLFGDTWAYHTDAEGRFVWHPSWGKNDSMAFFERPVDFAACHTMADIDRQLRENKEPVAPDIAAAPKLSFFVKEKPKSGEPRFYETAIGNLKPGQALGPFEVPTGAFALNDRLYVFYNVRHQETRKPDGKRVTYFLNTILARSDETSAAWKASAPPRLTRLYDVSEHPVIAEPLNPPDDENGAGKFIHVAPVVLSLQSMAKDAAATLPEPLRKADKVIFLWGASWKYAHSNLYLAAVSAADIEAASDGIKDASKWWYYQGEKAGKPEWGQEESAAASLLNDWREGGGPCIGEHDVKWCEALGCFLLSYQDRYTEIKFRSAVAPWGKWSKEMRVFGLLDAEAAKFIHRDGQNTISANPVKVFKPDGQPFLAPEKSGATYGAYQFDQVTKREDGSVEVYFTMSTWTTYNVFLMKTRFKPLAH